MICPKDTTEELLKGLENINKLGIEKDVKENGIKAIIHRELANHEAQITYSIEDTVYALSGYPITKDDIRAEFREYMDYCVKNGGI